MRERFIATLADLAANDPRIMLVTGDLGFGVFDDYRRRFPRQFLNAGVAEQNMTMVATGLALEGHVVFTYSIANFPTLRCLEMIRNDAAYHGANVNVVAVGGGFSYGALGMSHHATEDLAILSALPEVVTLAPTTGWEVEQSTRAIAARPGASYLRLDRSPGPDESGAEPFVIGQPRQVVSGTDAVILVTGGLLDEVLLAAKALGEDGISAGVFSIHSISPMDVDAIRAIAKSTDVLVTVEEHSVHGGLAGNVLGALADSGAVPQSFVRIGLPRRFVTEVGSQTYLRGLYGLDAAAIADRVRDAIRMRTRG